MIVMESPLYKINSKNTQWSMKEQNPIKTQKRVLKRVTKLTNNLSFKEEMSSVLASSLGGGGGGGSRTETSSGPDFKAKRLLL